MNINLNLTSAANNVTFSQVISSDVTLHDILIYYATQDDIKYQDAALQRQHYEKTNFLQYTGIPPKESFGSKEDDSIVKIQYNMPGLMKPVITCNGHVFSSHEIDFLTTSAQVLINASDKSTPTTINATLSHQYTTDHVSKKAQQNAIASVMKSFNVGDHNNESSTKHNTSKPQGPSVNDLPPELASQLNALAFEDPTLFAPVDGMDSNTALLVQINKMLSNVESCFPLDPPKVIVSARVQYPSNPQGSNNTKTYQNDEIDQDQSIGPHMITPNAAKLDKRRKTNDNSDVPSDEITDSDDDRFYEHNKKDYRVLHNVYTSHRRDLKKKAEEEKRRGKSDSPFSLIAGQSESDDDDVANRTQGGAKVSITKPTPNPNQRNTPKPQSLTDLAKQMKAQKQATKSTTPPSVQPQSQPQLQQKPQSTINTSFKSKDGKFAPAALTYRFRMPTIFYPLLSQEELDPTSPNYINFNSALETQLSSPATTPYPVLVLNISLQVQIPSTMTIFALYQLLSELISKEIFAYISQHMGTKPNTPGSASQTTSPIDKFPFIISSAAPPYTQFTSQVIYQPASTTQQQHQSQQKYKYPLLINTTMRNFNLPHRSAFIFHWRQITEGTNPQKSALNFGSFLFQQLTSKFIDPYTIIQQDQLTAFLSPILARIDEVQA